ncbi:MAG TPA: KH domain-containing protein [Victivallales bacterium]|nr:KH domain-containing protein [Victivallales bacterium]
MEAGMQMPEKIEKTVTTLATMLDYLGLDAEIKAEERNGRIIIKATSEEAGRIIGRRGQALESLQFLINRMMLKFDNAFPRIVIDVDGYSRRPSGDRGGRGERREDREDRGDRDNRRDERPRRGGDRGGMRRERPQRFSDGDVSAQSDEDRDAILKQQALDAAKEVKRWGDSVTLPPMNSHERRVIHTTLKDDAEIVTESLETDNPKLKRVVVKVSSGEEKKSGNCEQQS